MRHPWVNHGSEKIQSCRVVDDPDAAGARQNKKTAMP
jgi:hypothetical protein